MVPNLLRAQTNVLSSRMLCNAVLPYRLQMTSLLPATGYCKQIVASNDWASSEPSQDPSDIENRPLSTRTVGLMGRNEMCMSEFHQIHQLIAACKELQQARSNNLPVWVSHEKTVPLNTLMYALAERACICADTCNLCLCY